MSSFLYAQLAQQKKSAAEAPAAAPPPAAPQIMRATATSPDDNSDADQAGAPPSGAASSTAQPTTTSGYVEALAALIPAEVMTLHALILTATTHIQSASANAPGVTTISDVPTLRDAFWGLTLLSLLMYLVPRCYLAWKAGVAEKTDWLSQMEIADWARATIPPLAFVAWTMLQRVTAFDAAFPACTESQRTVAGLFLAAILVACASWLAFKPANRAS